MLLTEQQLNIEKSSNNLKPVNKPTENNFYACSCDAGTTTLTIESNGEIFPCNLFVEPEYCLGNIKEVNDLQELLQKILRNLFQIVWRNLNRIQSLNV